MNSNYVPSHTTSRLLHLRTWTLPKEKLYVQTLVVKEMVLEVAFRGHDCYGRPAHDFDFERQIPCYALVKVKDEIDSNFAPAHAPFFVRGPCP